MLQIRIVNISGIQEKLPEPMITTNIPTTIRRTGDMSFHNILNDVSISLGLNPVDVFDYYKK